ncbi:MAG: hypothetical protein ACRDJN_10550, partial [Chloroflexota bacterium]
MVTGTIGAGSRAGATRITRRGMLGGASVGVSGVLAGALLAACDAGFGAGGGTRTRAPAKVAFWNYGGGGVSDQLFEAVAQGYREQFPQITL